MHGVASITTITHSDQKSPIVPVSTGTFLAKRMKRMERATVFSHVVWLDVSITILPCRRW